LGATDLKSLESLQSLEQLGSEISLEAAMRGLAPVRDHRRINKWQTRVQSILNTRQREGPIEIHSAKNWINPDDSSSNRVLIAYYPDEGCVRIQIFQNAPPTDDQLTDSNAQQ